MEKGQHMSDPQWFRKDEKRWKCLLCPRGCSLEIDSSALGHCRVRGLKDGQPYLSFAVQGGDTQDQNLLQFFLNMVEFGMNVQEACEAANITSYQMRNSFRLHKVEPGRLTLHESVPTEDRDVLGDMGYTIDVRRKTSGPINAIFFDWKHGSLWGGSSNYGDDYGIVW